MLAALDLLCEPDPPSLPVVLAAWFHDAVYDGEPGADEQASADLARSRLSTLEAGPAAPSTGVGRTAPATGHTAASTDRTGADTSQAPSNCDRNPPSAGPTAPSTDAPATGTDAPTAGTDDHAGTGARPAAQQDHLSSEVARLVLLTATHSPEPGDHHGALLCDADLAVLARDPAGYRRYTADVRAEYAHVPEADFIKGRAAVVGHLMDLDPLYRTARGRELWQDRARANLRAELDALTQP